MMRLGECAVSWCAVEGLHGRHYDIWGQWLATSVTDQPEHVVTVQFGIESFTANPIPALALVLPDGTLHQVDAAMDWDELEQLAHRMLEAVERFRIERPVTKGPFTCPAVMYHGPGSQSNTPCERRDRHDLDDEHYARNPMEPGFEWTGQDGWLG